MHRAVHVCRLYVVTVLYEDAGSVLPVPLTLEFCACQRLTVCYPSFKGEKVVL